MVLTFEVSFCLASCGYKRCCALEEVKEKERDGKASGFLSIPADHITSWADESENLEPGDVEPWSAPSSPSGRREVRIRSPESR